VLFVAVWFGIGSLPKSVVGEDMRSYLMLALAVVFGTVVNVL